MLKQYQAPQKSSKTSQQPASTSTTEKQQAQNQGESEQNGRKSTKKAQQSTNPLENKKDVTPTNHSNKNTGLNTSQQPTSTIKSSKSKQFNNLQKFIMSPSPNLTSQSPFNLNLRFLGRDKTPEKQLVDKSSLKKKVQFENPNEQASILSGKSNVDQDVISVRSSAEIEEVLPPIQNQNLGNTNTNSNAANQILTTTPNAKNQKSNALKGQNSNLVEGLAQNIQQMNGESNNPFAHLKNKTANGQKQQNHLPDQNEILDDQNSYLQHLDNVHREDMMFNPVSEVSSLPMQLGNGANLQGTDNVLLMMDEARPKRRILDRIARIELDVQPDEPCIVSYHYEYKDFLQDWGVMDIEQAQKEEEQEKRNMLNLMKQNKEKKEEPKEGNGSELDDDDEGSIMEDSSVLLANCGKSKYETMLKSMIARIEFNNSLAPIQEYGRHQQRGANKKKKNKKKKKEGEHGMIQDGDSAEDVDGKKYQDNFYDLDDEFIDDNDLEINHDEMISEMFDQSNVFSQTPGAESQEPNVFEQNEDEIEAYDDEDGNVEGINDIDEDDVKLEQRYNKLLKTFKVLSAEEVDEMIAQKDLLEQHKKDQQANQQNRESNQLTITQLINQNANPNQKVKFGNVITGNPNIGSSAEKPGKPTKKRKFDEMDQSSQMKVDEIIDEIINNLRNRVLIGETLNNFKKEMQQLSEQVEKLDSTWEGHVSSAVSYKLGQMLSKPEKEMLFMLKRTSFLDKKKKKKAELDKILSIVKTKIEFDLKTQNKKKDQDYVDLEQLEPETFSYYISDDLAPVLKQGISAVDQFVNTNKEYFSIKQKEEQVKQGKKQLRDGTIKFENCDIYEETEKFYVNILCGIPEPLKDKVRAKIMACVTNNFEFVMQVGKVQKSSSNQGSRDNTVDNISNNLKTGAKNQTTPTTPNPAVQGKNQDSNTMEKSTKKSKQAQAKAAAEDNMPKKGCTWNKITAFYENFAKKN
eukprot:403376879